MDLPPQDRPFQPVGWVRTKEPFITIDPDADLNKLCANYYNKAAASLLREARKAGADAVVSVRSVTFLLNGATEEHKTPECADDGGEGEILLKGVAVRWIPQTKSSIPKPMASPSPASKQ